MFPSKKKEDCFQMIYIVSFFQSSFALLTRTVSIIVFKSFLFYYCKGFGKSLMSYVKKFLIEPYIYSTGNKKILHKGDYVTLKETGLNISWAELYLV